MGFSYKRPRMKSLLADPIEQELFLKAFPERIEEIVKKGKEKGRKAKILCTDEAGFRRDGTLHSGWYRKGEIAEIPESNGRFESIKMLGAVDPLEGDFTLKKAPKRIVSEDYGDFLVYLSKRYPDRELIVLEDNAPWHSEKRVWKVLKDNEIDNVHRIRFPKYSPKMNSCEKLWKWLRESVTHCRYHESLKDLMACIWSFYRRVWRDKEKAKIRFQSEIPIFSNLAL